MYDSADLGLATIHEWASAGGLRKRMHTEQAAYCVYVLWLSGYSKRSVAERTGLSESRVRGIISRSPWRRRIDLAFEERQHLLDDYRAVRLDGCGRSIDDGLLDSFDWQCRPIESDFRTSLAA